RGSGGRGRAGSVGGPSPRRVARRAPPPRRCQSARHAGLRGRALRVEAPMTWSIIARDPTTGCLGIAVASKFLAVGARVPHIAADVGAVATQALVNPFYGPRGLALLRENVPPP